MPKEHQMKPLVPDVALVHILLFEAVVRLWCASFACFGLPLSFGVNTR